MYLTDTDYRENDFFKSVIRNYNEEPKFDISPEGQIQPASIDLRLSNIVWFQKRVLFSKIDVSKHGAFDFAASKYWKEKIISEEKPLKIKPNETVFCRIHEQLVIPENCAAKIEAKSSIVRLSLSVTYSDFCNPKYVGHYPLQIHNSGKNTVVLYPYMEICQLILVKLKDTVSVSYDDNSRESIYAKFDDGSPTKWWDTKTNKEMRKQLSKRNGSEPIDPLMDKIDIAVNASFKDSDFIEENKKQVYKRLEKFIGKNSIISTDKTFGRFLKIEKRKFKFFNNIFWKMLISATPIILIALSSIITFISGKIKELFQNFNAISLSVIIICTILLILSFIFSNKIFHCLSDYAESYLVKDE